MARQFTIKSNSMLGVKDGVTFFDADLPPVRLYPDSKKITTTKTVSFPDFHHANAYAYAAGDVGGGVIQQSCSSFVTIPFQEWGPSTDFAITDILGDVTIGTVPADADFLYVRVKGTRTNAPDQVNGNDVPVAFQEGQWVSCDGGTLLVEFLWPITRMIRISLAAADNGDGTRNVILSRKQSISKRGYSYWRSGNDSNNSGWTYGGTNGRYGHIVKKIQSKGPTTAIGGVITYRRGDGAQCSLSDTSDYSADYTFDLEILPGYSGIAARTSGGGGGGGTELVLTDGDSVSPNASTHTYTSKYLGPVADAAQTRHVIVAVTGWRRAGSNSQGLSSVSVAGNAATLLFQRNFYRDETGSNDTNQLVAYYGLRLDAGETGNIVLNFSATFVWSAIDVYAAYNLPSLTPLTTQSAVGENTNGDGNYAFTTQPYGPIIATAMRQGLDLMGWDNFVPDDVVDSYSITSPVSTTFYHRRSAMLASGTSFNTNLTLTAGGTRVGVWAALSLPGAKPKRIELVDSGSQGAASSPTSYTVNFGDAPLSGETRHIIVGVVAAISGASRTISMTIGGVAATQVATGSTSGTSTDRTSLFIAAVPTGTSGNVVITASGGSFNGTVLSGVYAAYNLDSATPDDIAQVNGTTSPYSDTLTSVARGFAILAGMMQPPQTFTGIANYEVEENTSPVLHGGRAFEQVYTTSVNISVPESLTVVRLAAATFH